MPYRTVGAFMLLCKKSAVQGLLQKQELIDFIGLRLQIGYGSVVLLGSVHSSGKSVVNVSCMD